MPSSPYDPRDVASAYDRTAAQWRATRPERMSASLERHLGSLLAHARPPARVLDLGCGAGVPVARELAQRGYAVTGLDLSEKQLEIARREVPTGVFAHGDMRTIAADALGAPFDLIVAWDSIFHLPSTDHASVFKKLRDWLIPGGHVLLSLGGSAWEGTSDMLGDTFFYSGLEPEESLRLLEASGLRVLHSEIDDPQSRGHLAIIATRETA